VSRAALLVGGVLLVLAVAPRQPARAQQSPSRSVFQLVVMAHRVQGPYRSEYRSVSAGTAFFISPDGTALTNSHVVYPVRGDRVTYSLLAILDREFYGAALVCASALPRDPARPDPQGVALSRDVAEVRLVPPQFPFDQLSSGGIPYARAHRGPLPAFPALSLGADPSVGDGVRVLGFGRIESPLPYEWSAQGTVSGLGRAPDGTPVFGIDFAQEAEPGHSGSPVLNVLDQVVGLYTWHRLSDATQGTAISVSALTPACP
jgi:S1-C subfamily serine protease